MKNAASLGLLILLACGGGTQPGKSRLAFEGIVTNAATGAPIAGVDIAVYGGNGLVPQTLQRTTTDAEGRYTTNAGCIVPAWVGAGMVGYSGRQLDVTCLAEVQTLNISLTASP